MLDELSVVEFVWHALQSVVRAKAPEYVPIGHAEHGAFPAISRVLYVPAEHARHETPSTLV